MKPTCIVKSCVGSISPLRALRSASSLFFCSSSSRVAILDCIFVTFVSLLSHVGDLCNLNSLQNIRVFLSFGLLRFWFTEALIGLTDGRTRTRTRTVERKQRRSFVPHWLYQNQTRLERSVGGGGAISRHRRCLVNTERHNLFVMQPPSFQSTFKVERTNCCIVIMER